MKARTRFSVLLSACCVVGICLGTACQKPAGRDSTLESEPDSMRYQSYESLKAGVPWHTKWWNTKVRGREFAICLQEFPSYGQSRQDVCAWRQDADGAFTLVWSIRVEGIGPIEIEVKEDVGTVLVRARGNTELKDSVIALAQLKATSG